MSSPRKRLSPDATLCVMRTREIAIEFHFILDSAPHRLLQLRRDVESRVEKQFLSTAYGSRSPTHFDIKWLTSLPHSAAKRLRKSRIAATRDAEKRNNRFRLLQPVSGFTLNLLPTMIKFSCWRIGFLIKSRKKGRDQQKSSVISQFPLKAESFGSIWNRTRLISLISFPFECSLNAGFCRMWRWRRSYVTGETIAEKPQFRVIRDNEKIFSI